MPLVSEPRAKPLKEARDELAWHAVAAILDHEAQVAVPSLGRDRDRWAAVPQRVRDQVGEHAIERRCIDDDLEVGRNGDRHRATGQGVCERSDQLLDLGS